MSYYRYKQYWRNIMTNLVSKQATETELKHNESKTALKVALNILNKWGCDEQEKMALLGIGRSTLHKYQTNPYSARITMNLIERISYLLNIHQSLRILFENKENIYGFIRMPNDNHYFEGKSPMERMKNGLTASLYEVNKQLDGLRGGQW